MAKYKTIIGRADTLDLPARLLTEIPAKTDTGAYMSSIHAGNIRVVTNSKGKKVLKCTLLENHASYPYSREVEFTTFSKTIVENSFGVQEERYKVELKVRMGGKVFRTPFTLANRSKKVFPVLIGRTFLNKRFLVDTDIAHIDRKLLKEKLKDWLEKDDKEDESVS